MARRKSGGNDKYLRLTGLWPSKNNEMLFTGKLKQEQIDDLLNKIDEAKDNDAPLMFSLWENDKKKSRKDPEFSLQCFVGDSEESPRSRRDSGSRDNQEDRGSRRSSRDKNSRDDNQDDNQDSQDDNQDNQDDNQDDPEQPEDQPEERSTRKKGASTRKGSTSRKEEAPRGKSKKRESW